MEVNAFQIFLIDVTFYLEHVQKLVFKETPWDETFSMLSILKI